MQNGHAYTNGYTNGHRNGHAHNHPKTRFYTKDDDASRVSTSHLDIEYHQPASSPYRTRPITLVLGASKTKYTVPQLFLNSHPKLFGDDPFAEFLSEIRLHDVHEDTGHTLVHYLHTGDYETLQHNFAQDNAKCMTEYRRAALVYAVARTYELGSLIALAKRYIERFSKGLSVYRIMDVAVEVYPRLQAEDEWYVSHVRKYILRAHLLDKGLFVNEFFLRRFGRDPVFDRFLMQTVLDIYSNKVLLDGERYSDRDVVSDREMFSEDVHEEEEGEEERQQQQQRSRPRETTISGRFGLVTVYEESSADEYPAADSAVEEPWPPSSPIAEFPEERTAPRSPAAESLVADFPVDEDEHVREEPRQIPDYPTPATGSLVLEPVPEEPEPEPEPEPLPKPEPMTEPEPAPEEPEPVPWGEPILEPQSYDIPEPVPIEEAPIAPAEPKPEPIEEAPPRRSSKKEKLNKRKKNSKRTYAIPEEKGDVQLIPS